MEQKYLPIGSVCTLKGKNKKVMITGYYSVEFNGNLKINDYSGCVYPEGMLLPEQNCTFNHSDIEQINFLGFENTEYQTFKKLLDKLTGNDITDEEKAEKFHKDNDMFLTSNSTYSKLLFDENGVVMIADPVVEEKKVKSKYNFDENGTVISINNQENVKNPFFKELPESKKVNDGKTKKWNIFKNIEFDEDGTVVSAEKEKKTTKSSNYKFSDTGVLIAEQKYEFDEYGEIVSATNTNLQDELKDEKKELSTKTFKFDDDGTILSEKEYTFSSDGDLLNTNETKFEQEADIEKIPPIGPGLPGYEEPKKQNKYSFDENGVVTAAPIISTSNEGEDGGQAPAVPNYQFDENGTVISS